MFTEQFRYCLEQLKRYDNNRYLAILLTPEKYQAKLCALYAFNVEMARIPYAVSEPMLGEIRFQWWRDTLEAMTPLSSPGHEIAEALRDLLFDGSLSASDFLPLIDAHARALTDEPFQSTRELIEDVKSTEVTYLGLALRIVGNKEPVSQRDENLCLAYGLIGMLRELPHAASRQRLTLPLDLMATYEIDPHDVFAGTYRLGTDHAVREICDTARDLFEAGRKQGLMDQSGHLSVLLPTSLTPLYLKKMGRAKFDIFRDSSDIPAFRRQLKYLRIKWGKRI